MKQERFKILAVCGGNGSWLYSMKEYLTANIEPRAVFYTPNNLQCRANFGKRKKLYSHLQPSEVVPANVIIGAPDCGSSSMMALTRSKKFSDPLENDSFNLFFNQVRESKPEIFFMENLPKAMPYIKSIGWLKKDYHLHFLVTSVTFFGNSQVGRVRLIVMGIRKDFKVNHKLIWKHITKPKKYKLKTTKQLLSGLTIKNYHYRFGHVTENINTKITIYAGKKMTLERIKKYWDSDPNQKRFIAKNRKYTTAPGVYRNLPNEYPQVARKTNRQFNPDGIQMSPRELARIQGIPDNFRIVAYYGRMNKDIGYWINKGRTTATKCPPYEVGLWMLWALKWIYEHKKLNIK